jgi:mannitol/fructose-specific phosphotransferase system IIA component (Ntr-type)
MTLADFTSRGMIIPHLRARTVASVIQELSQAMQREGRLADFLPFYHAALNRELLVTTNFEHGMAFPHARLSTVSHLSFAFGRAAEPLDWGVRGDQSVRMVFLLAVPQTDSTQYLLLVAGLARLAKNKDFLAKLQAPSDSEGLFRLLQAVDLRPNPSAQRYNHPPL